MVCSICMQKPIQHWNLLQYHRKRSTWHSTLFREILPLLFARFVNVITNYKPFVAIFKKDLATLSQWLQCILLRILQYEIHIIQTRTRPVHSRLPIKQNHVENKDEEIDNLKLSIIAIDITTNVPACMTIQDIQGATHNDIYLQVLRACIIDGWLTNRVDVKQDIWPYWILWDELAKIDWVAIEGSQ